MAVQIIRDNYRIINDNSNLKQTFVIGSWNIRELQPKKEIAQSLANKDVKICGLQERQNAWRTNPKKIINYCLSTENLPNMV